MTNKIKLQIHKIGRYEMNTAIQIWFLLTYNEMIKDINESTVDGKMFIEIEFDINPKDWMLKIMRHLRILRVLMPQWHKREKKIALEIRHQLLNIIPKIKKDSYRQELKKIDNIKGYREVRYMKSLEKINV